MNESTLAEFRFFLLALSLYLTVGLLSLLVVHSAKKNISCSNSITAIDSENEMIIFAPLNRLLINTKSAYCWNIDSNKYVCGIYLCTHLRSILIGKP